MRAEVGSFLILNAGNLLFKREFFTEGKSPPARLQADLILASYDQMGCDAFNIGAYDLALGIDYLLEREKISSFPFISTNLTDKHGRPFFQTYRLIEIGGTKVGIFGLLDDDLKQDKIPGGYKLFVHDPIAAAEAVVPKLRAEGAEFIILLTNMVGRQVRKLSLLDVPIDLIVSSDKRNQISLPIVSGDTFITHLDRGGKSVGRLDVTAGSVAEITDTSEEGHKNGQRVGRNVFRNFYVQLRLSYADHPVIGAMVRKFDQELAVLQKGLLAADTDSDDGDCGTAYVGISACRKCHPDRYAHWAKTDHAHAYATLEAKNKQYDEDCLPCHVLAFECDEAPTIKNVVEFANVQCESCHGPGDLHVASGGKQGTQPIHKPERVCMRCHTPERTEDIDFNTMASEVCGETP